MKLRTYQERAVSAICADWGAGLRRVAAVLPTGAGKTVIFSKIIEMCAAAGRPSLVLAHRDELINQAVDKIGMVAPTLRVGVVKAARNEIEGRDVVVASVQSLRTPARRAQLAAAGFRLVVVDETHHATARTYRETLSAVDAWADDWVDGALVLGVTATLDRADGIALGSVLEKVSITVPIRDLIVEGFLLRPRGIRVMIEGLDLRGVARTGGDYRDGALGEAMHDALAPAAIARAYREHCPDRQGIAFLPTVDLAHEQADAFRDEGISAAAIDGVMSVEDRRKILDESARGGIQVITNCMVLTEGTDMPHVSAIVLGRPTSSAGLYTQMVGRGLRPYPGQSDCVVLDVCGVTGRHRLATLAVLGGADLPEGVPDDLLRYEDDEPDEGLALSLDDGYGAVELAAGVDGRLVHEMVDLFGQSHAAWKRTARGVWYLSVGDRYLFLAPAEQVQRYNLGWCSTAGGAGGWLREGMDLGYAMAEGEEMAYRDGGRLVGRGERWRTDAPGVRQIAQAKALGIPVDHFTTKGELSDQIDQVKASGRIDHIAVVQGVTPEGYWR